MDKGNSEQYSIPALMKINGIDIRGLARTDPMPAAAYFDSLSQFVRRAPQANGALMKFVNRNGDIDAYKGLDNVITALKDIGCKAYVTEFYSILGAYETGNWRLASHYAEKVADGFNQFCGKVASCKIIGENDNFPDAGLLLEDYITRLEEEDDGRKMVVLAVDDSPVILKSVSSVLSNEYKVYTLLKPAMLASILAQITPELFLLDYKMPDISGFELIPIIRSFEEHKQTPIIFLTSDGTIDNLTAAISLGACDYIVKPFNPDALRGKIAKWIVRKKRVV